MDARSQEKKKRLEEALERGVVMVHLDARRAGVLVPQKFRSDYHLRLNLSYNFDPPDLTVGDWGARQTLSFNRTPFKVALPWQAIFAITGNSASGQAWLFPEDMPQELLEAAARSQVEGGEELGEFEVVPPAASEATGLSVVPPAEESEAPRPRFVPRLIKPEPGAEVVQLNPAAQEPADQDPAAEPAAEPVRPVALKLAPLAPAAQLVAVAAVPLPAASELEVEDGPPGPEAQDAGDASAAMPPPDDGKPKRSHLRLIK
jgi:stringent starvation protein B